MTMNKPKNYSDPTKKKMYKQKPLFEEEDDENEKKQTNKEIPADNRKEAICDACKKPIIYDSDDLHPGIICQGCGNGQNNPNLKGVMWA